MTNENAQFEEKLLHVQKQYLCGVHLVNFDWNSLLDDLSWENQPLLVAKTVDFDLAGKYPLKINYQKAFLKFVIDHLVRKGSEIHDCVYGAFGRIVAHPSGDSANYKHYLNSESGQIITIKESANFISEGTTGLCTWQASLVLSEWCLSNRSVFENRNILELGSGVGLAGISIALNCSPLKIYLSDCHKSVLEVLRENALLNSARFETLDGRIEILELNWEDINEFSKNTPNIDVVVCADVVYDYNLFEPLINTFSVFLHKNNTTKIILACTERNKETLGSFLNDLEKNRIKYLELEVPTQKNYIWDTTTPIKIFQLDHQ